jgi:two-component system, LytTR family, response regulator
MTARLRVLIVDDERLARQKVRTFLAARDDVEIAGEAANAAAAIDLLERTHPDLVILDIQMPGGDGFEVVKALGPHPPAIVFATAHDEYAVRAFDIAAVDYLLKPFDRRRFEQAMGRARKALAPNELADLIAAWEASRKTPEQFLVKKRDRMILVPVKDVDWIEAEAKYVRIHVREASYLIRDSIAAVEARLDPRQFVRIHRSTIVNMRRVAELQRGFGGDVIVVLNGGTRLTMSRRYRGHVREATGLDV